MIVEVNWRIVIVAVAIGVCIGLATGLVENKPAYASIPETKYYGYPFIWRISDPFTGADIFLSKAICGCSVLGSNSLDNAVVNR